MNDEERSLIKDQMIYRLLACLHQVAPNQADDMAEQIDFALFEGKVRNRKHTHIKKTNGKRNLEAKEKEGKRRGKSKIESLFWFDFCRLKVPFRKGIEPITKAAEGEAAAVFQDRRSLNTARCQRFEAELRKSRSDNWELSLRLFLSPASNR
jgi:hypothetical protein